MWILICVTGWLLAASVMDIRTRRVPIWMFVLGGGLTAIVIFYHKSGYFDILRGTVPGLCLLAIAFVTKKAGYGDGIALSYLGMVLGGEKALLLLGISSFLLALCSLTLLALRKVERNTGMPFLPFLTVAWIIITNM